MGGHLGLTVLPTHLVKTSEVKADNNKLLLWWHYVTAGGGGVASTQPGPMEVANHYCLCNTFI